MRPRDGLIKRRGLYPGEGKGVGERGKGVKEVLKKSFRIG